MPIQNIHCLRNINILQFEFMVMVMFSNVKQIVFREFSSKINGFSIKRSYFSHPLWRKQHKMGCLKLKESVAFGLRVIFSPFGQQGNVRHLDWPPNEVTSEVRFEVSLERHLNFLCILCINHYLYIKNEQKMRYWKTRLSKGDILRGCTADAKFNVIFFHSHFFQKVITQNLKFHGYVSPKGDILV